MKIIKRSDLFPVAILAFINIPYLIMSLIETNYIIKIILLVMSIIVTIILIIYEVSAGNAMIPKSGHEMRITSFIVILNPILFFIGVGLLGMAVENTYSMGYLGIETALLLNIGVFYVSRFRILFEKV